MDNIADALRTLLISLSPRAKKAVILSVDVCLIAAALWLAFFARLGTDQIVNPLTYYWLFLAAIGTALPAFAWFGLYRAVSRYLGRDAIVAIFNSVTLAALLLALSIYWIRSDLLIPRMLVANYWVILGLLIGASRFVAWSFLAPSRNGRKITRLLSKANDGRRRIAIYGAGAAGYQLYRSLQHDRDLAPVAFFDDDRDLTGRRIGELVVYPPDRVDDVMQRTGMREIFLAIPSISPKRRKEILDYLQQFPVRVKTVPSIYELTTGRKQLSQLQDVRAEDLLGREVVKPSADLLERCIRDKVVMVTGAGGSIGSELCRQIAVLRPTTLVLLDNSEYSLFQIEEELREDISQQNLRVELVSILASITDPDRLRRAISNFSVNTIYHAAAYKHVPMVEHNVAAGIANNVLGTLYTARTALEQGVEHFVLVSTDKAVRPTNIMGATKRLAEMILQSLNRELKRTGDGSRTRFTMVRFGNVIGSSGSVIPKFRRQIESGGPVTVTDTDVIRYFMTIPEAAQLVIQAGSMGDGGDVFVLDMGAPVRIMDLATKMIRLSGLTVRDAVQPEGDIEIRLTGLRPGEKLYEELLIGDVVRETGHPKIMRAEEDTLDWPAVSEILNQLEAAIDEGDCRRAVAILANCVDGFRPHAAIVDPLDNAQASTPDNVLPLGRRLP